MHYSRQLIVMLFCALCSTMEAGLLSSLMWWKPREQEAEKPMTLEEQIGGWLGETMKARPERQVRVLVLHGGSFEKCGRAWGAAARCLPAKTGTLFMLFAPPEDSREARIIIPELERLKTELGDVPLDVHAIEELKNENRGLVVSGRMNESGLTRISQIASVFLVKLRTYKIVPMFLGGRTDCAQVQRMLLPYMKDSSTVLLTFMPDQWSSPLLEAMGQAISGEGNALPGTLRIAAGVVSSLGLQVDEGALTSPPDKSIDTGALSGRILFCQNTPEMEAAGQSTGQEGFLTSFEGRILLDFVRDVLDSQLKKTASPSVPSFSRNYVEPYGCQVYLLKDGKSVAQATSMPGSTPLSSLLVVTVARFLREDASYKLTAEELPKLKIRLGVLSVPEPLPFGSLAELYEKLPSGQGVLIEIDGKKAGFLPQVWKQVSRKEDFMAALCRRLSKTPQDLLAEGAKVQTFKLIEFEEGK